MGKARVTFRKCRLCSGEWHKGDKESGNPMLQVCNCLGYVHRKCQEQLMSEEGVVACDRCLAPFRAIRYEKHEPRGILNYVCEVPAGRSELIATVSLVTSMVLALSSLANTCWYELDRTVEQLTDIEIGLRWQVLLHNINTVLLGHAKLVLPCMAVYIAIVAVHQLVLHYLAWQATHFYVTIPEQPRPSSPNGHYSAKGTKKSNRTNKSEIRKRKSH